MRPMSTFFDIQLSNSRVQSHVRRKRSDAEPAEACKAGRNRDEKQKLEELEEKFFKTLDFSWKRC